MKNAIDNQVVKNKELRFYKEGAEWFADVPEHTQAENRMVAGADVLIESFANGGMRFASFCLQISMIQIRIRSVLSELNTIVGGRPISLISKDACCRVRRGFAMLHIRCSVVSIRRPSTFIRLQPKG